jgi:hypothetical protein
MDIQRALLLLRPEASWACNGETYEGLIWHNDNEFEKPSKEEVEAKIQELRAAEPMRLLRIHRDKLLAETDWVTMRSYSTNTPVPEEWATYQQALRDLPETATPILDYTNPLSISGVDWPVKPQ